MGGYLADRYDNKRYKNWRAIKAAEKLDILERERKKIFRYNKWGQVNNKLFGSIASTELRVPTRYEVDGRSDDGKNHGGPAESIEHKKLKQWVANNAEKLGLIKSFGTGQQESPLLSGDTVDVLFSDGNEYVVVEVKSCRSNDEDIRRGIYQCVKYKAVKEAEHYPNKISVRALLVTESSLSSELITRSRLLNVGFRWVRVNKKMAARRG